MADAAWDGYSHSRKSPRTRRAGEGYADPDYQLAHAWMNAADAVHAALRAHRDDAEHRILLINASPRSEHTCPGEMSKSYRLAQMAQSLFLDEHAKVDLLDLSRPFGIRAPVSSLQSLLFNVPGALPLAMLLLPESFSRAGARLDERNLSAVSRRPRGYDYHARQLVSDDVTSEIDDGSTGMCRWRKSGPNDDTWSQDAARAITESW